VFDVLLSDTWLDGSQIQVSSASDASEHESHVKNNEERDSDEITQEEKPRARILAEYLAHGYVVGDAALQRAIELDHKHGVTTRFFSTLQSLDAKYHATDRARSADTSYSITHRANSLLTGIGSYFEKATNTPTGQRVVKFYSEGQKQVADIHAEAKRLAEIKKQEHGGSAYKAAGLDKVFGPEKTKPSAPEAAASSAAPEADNTTDSSATNIPPKA